MPTRKKTRQAIINSIAHWGKLTRIRKLENAKIFTSSCPLCAIYYYPARLKHAPTCVGCPVARKVGERECRRTPWNRAARARSYWCDYPDSKERAAIFRMHARGMHSFLTDILREFDNDKT